VRDSLEELATSGVRIVLATVKRARDALQRELATTHNKDLSQLTQELITSRQTLQQTAEAERRSERRWRAVYENSAVGIGLIDVGGNFLAVNAASQRMLGYTEEEFQKTLFDADHAEGRL
jgi:PAS domain-containing protein